MRPPACPDRVLRALALALLVLLQSVAPAWATIYTWAPAAGGLTNTSVNWSPAGVPGANDDTRFWQSSVTYTITTASPADTFATAWASGGGHPQFSCSDPLRVRNQFTVDGGSTASIIGGFARAGWFTVGPGTFTITGAGTEVAATNPSASTYFGNSIGFNTTVNISGAGFQAPLIYVPEFNSIVGTLNVAGAGGNLHLVDQSGVYGTGVIWVGNQGVGDLELSNGGNVSVDNWAILGGNGYGRLHMFRNNIRASVPTLYSRLLYLGQNTTFTSAGSGTLVIDAGLARTDDIVMGDDDGSMPDTVRMNGGILWVFAGLRMHPDDLEVLDLRGGTMTLGNPFYLTPDGVDIEQAGPLTLSGSPTLTVYSGGFGGPLEIPTTSLTTASAVSMSLGRNAGGTFRAIGDGYPGDRFFSISGGVVIADSLAGTGTMVADTASGLDIGGTLTAGPGNASIQVRRGSAIQVSGETDIVGGASTGAAVLISDSLSAGYFGGLAVGGTLAGAIPGAASVTVDSSATMGEVGGMVRVWKGGGLLALKTRTVSTADSVLCSGSVSLSSASLSTYTSPGVRGPIRIFDTGQIHGTGTLLGRIQLADSTASLAILGSDPAGGTLAAGDTAATDGFTNAGTVDVEQDTLVLLNKGVAPLGHVTLGGGTLRVPQGGHVRAQDVLEGTAGRIDGDILDDGLIHPSGAIDVAGHVTCLAGAITGSYLNGLPGSELSVRGNQSGTLRIGGRLDMGPTPWHLNLSSTLTLLPTAAVTMRIGSRASHVQDTLALSQPVTLNGTLDLRTWKPAPPQVGDTLTLITAPAITGTFAAVTIDSVNAPSVVQPIYSATSVKVVILHSTTGVPHQPSAAAPPALRFAAAGTPAAAALELDLPAAADVRVALYDVSGRRVAQPLSGALAAGRHRVALATLGLPSGVYFARAEVGAGVELSARIVWLR
ncbi:MAG TPA: hypothetical protein VFK69_04260 [Candidatus Eisenbacteria bacterium]|nr:hypothetical protein [Candidatus Eisenbacteria bacterium]